MVGFGGRDDQKSHDCGCAVCRWDVDSGDYAGGVYGYPGYGYGYGYGCWPGYGYINGFYRGYCYGFPAYGYRY